MDPALVKAFALGALVAGLLVFVLLARRERRIRDHALAGSRAVLRGQVAEQLAPFTEEFPWDSADARFLGHPIDYVVFDGLAADEEELEIVLVEIKTGAARLSKREAAIRRAIEEGRVRFEIVRM